MKKAIARGLVVCLVLVAAACAQPPPVGSMSLTIGYTATGAAYSDLYVCQDKGIFQANGLNVRLTLLNSASQLGAALISNTVQIGVGPAQSTAIAAMNLENIHLRYISLPIPRYYLEAWGGPDIGSMADLKGRRIGLSSPDSLGDNALDALLAQQGWPEDAVQKKYLKSTAAEVTALENGAVDVIITQPPTGTQTRDRGFHRVMAFTEFPTAANAYTAKQDYLDDNPAAVAAFVKSEAQCLAILHHDPQTAVASIMKHSSVPSRQLAEYAYDFFAPLWARDPEVDPALIDHDFAITAARLGKPKPADTGVYIDNGPLDSLRRSGYLASLY